MKRVRPAASIEEWVAQMVTLAVKSGNKSLRAKSLDNAKEENARLKDVIRRYETLLVDMDTLGDILGYCAKCDQVWKQEDLFDCEGRCDWMCNNCSITSDCTQCGERRCDDSCIRYCDAKGCLNRLCKECFGKNMPCGFHDLCEEHKGPCPLCSVEFESFLK